MSEARPDRSASATATDPVYAEAWQALRGAHQLLVDRVGRELGEAGLPELSWHDVLARLDESELPLRPRDLLCHVAVTKSGLTRLLDRIESAGLLERRSCPSDRRGTFLAITDAGRETLTAMRPIRDGVFEQHFEGVLSRDDAAHLADSLGRVGAGVRGELEAEGACEL
jgi:DNA-binding MarR family transcriptional regulator